MKSNRKAYTLVEILIATSIFTLVGIGLITLVVSALKMYAFNAAQLSLVTDVRKVTSELAQHAEFANYFVILKDYDSRTVTESGVTRMDTISDGFSGDCLVLVYKDPDDNTKINKVMGYYWVKGSGDDGVLYRFENKISPSSSGNVWDLMPGLDKKGTHRVVVDGVSRTSGLFYNFYNRSVMTNCRITQKATNHKNATFTYNFTVSPRG